MDRRKWRCERCEFLNALDEDECTNCGYEKPDNPEIVDPDDDLVTEASKDSFPASDPPPY